MEKFKSWKFTELTLFNFSSGSNKFLTILKLSYPNGKKSTVNRALGGSTYTS